MHGVGADFKVSFYCDQFMSYHISFNKHLEYFPFFGGSNPMFLNPVTIESNLRDIDPSKIKLTMKRILKIM